MFLYLIGECTFIRILSMFNYHNIYKVSLVSVKPSWETTLQIPLVTATFYLWRVKIMIMTQGTSGTIAGIAPVNIIKISCREFKWRIAHVHTHSNEIIQAAFLACLSFYVPFHINFRPPCWRTGVLDFPFAGNLRGEKIRKNFFSSDCFIHFFLSNKNKWKKMEIKVFFLEVSLRGEKVWLSFWHGKMWHNFFLFFLVESAVLEIVLVSSNEIKPRIINRFISAR